MFILAAQTTCRQVLTRIVAFKDFYMHRRRFLNLSLLTFSIGSLGACASSSPSKKVFMGYTQSELDDAYNQDVWAHPGFERTIQSYGDISERVKRKYAFKTFSYGGKASEVLDVFAPDDAIAAPIHVFIHGGAWRSLSKDTSSGPAPVFVTRGGIYIALNFDNIPATTLAGMVEQCRSALLWVYRNAEKIGGDRNRITLSGHSSGAHLAGVMLTTEWSRYGVPNKLIQGAVLISGMCDLEAPMLSFRANYLKLTPTETYAFSPIHFVSKISCPVFVVWGQHESPEFKRQSITFAQALKSAGRLQGSLELAGIDHLEAALELNDPKSVVANIALRQMDLDSSLAADDFQSKS